MSELAGLPATRKRRRFSDDAYVDLGQPFVYGRKNNISKIYRLTSMVAVGKHTIRFAYKRADDQDGPEQMCISKSIGKHDHKRLLMLRQVCLRTARCIRRTLVLTLSLIVLRHSHQQDASVQEVEVLNTLGAHHHILPLTDSFDEAREVHLIFPYCDGADLPSFLSSQVVNEELTGPLTKGMLLGVGHAHANGALAAIWHLVVWKSGCQVPLSCLLDCRGKGGMLLTWSEK